MGCERPAGYFGCRSQPKQDSPVTPRHVLIMYFGSMIGHSHLLSVSLYSRLSLDPCHYITHSSFHPHHPAVIYLAPKSGMQYTWLSAPTLRLTLAMDSAIFTCIRSQKKTGPLRQISCLFL